MLDVLVPEIPSMGPVIRIAEQRHLADGLCQLVKDILDWDIAFDAQAPDVKKALASAVSTLVI